MPLHPVLDRELCQSKRLQKFFNSLPESTRRDIDHSVREVKKEDTRLRRAQHAAEYLMEAMEAELDPPSMMKTAFRRNCPGPPGMATHAAITSTPIPHRYLPQPLPGDSSSPP
jgi:hypothetical protein